MARKVLAGLIMLAIISSSKFAFCAEKDFPKQKIIDIATTAVKDEGIALKEVDIIYDENGRLWSEKTGFLVGEDKSPNHGILRKGFLKNYRVVYFDFKDPIKDVWVFIDKDSGEVLTVYRE